MFRSDWDEKPSRLCKSANLLMPTKAIVALEEKFAFDTSTQVKVWAEVTGSETS